MVNYRTGVPSLSAMSAFECVARHGNFSRAATELNSSQPVVSRHVAGLESSLGTKLFVRARGGVSLTQDGSRLYRSVVAGLDEIVSAVQDIRVQAKRVSIGCSHAVSHLWLMSRYDRLQESVGYDVELVTVTAEYEYQPRLQEDGIDINLMFSDGPDKGGDKYLLFPEEVFPVCSPEFFEREGDRLARAGLAALCELPLLHLGQRNYGWVTWDSWFAAQGMECPPADELPRFGNYVYLLEAASNGAGVALGWSGLVDGYLSQGRLVALTDAHISTNGGLYLSINPSGRNTDLARKAAACLASLTVRPASPCGLPGPL